MLKVFMIRRTKFKAVCTASWFWPWQRQVLNLPVDIFPVLQLYTDVENVTNSFFVSWESVFLANHAIWRWIVLEIFMEIILGKLSQCPCAVLVTYFFFWILVSIDTQLQLFSCSLMVTLTQIKLWSWWFSGWTKLTFYWFTGKLLPWTCLDCVSATCYWPVCMHNKGMNFVVAIEYTVLLCLTYC